LIDSVRSSHSSDSYESGHERKSFFNNTLKMQITSDFKDMGLNPKIPSQYHKNLTNYGTGFD